MAVRVACRRKPLIGDRERRKGRRRHDDGKGGVSCERVAPDRVLVAFGEPQDACDRSTVTEEGHRRLPHKIEMSQPISILRLTGEPVLLGRCRRRHAATVVP